MNGEVGSLGDTEPHELPAAPSGRGRRRRISISAAVDTHPAIALAALAIVSAALHALLVGSVHGPFVFMDELGYERMALSVARTGHLALFGKVGLAYSPLYPIVLSPVYALTSSAQTAYEWTKLENAVLISLSVFPVYGIARFVLSRGRSVGAAALSLLAPLMLYSSFEMSENLAYPLCLVAIWAMLRAVSRPSLGGDALLLTAIVLASAARLELVALLPAAVTAVLLVALFRRPRPEPSRGRAVLRAVTEHRLLFGVCALVLVAGLARTAMNGGNLPLAGRYANVGSAHASAWRVLTLFFQHLAELDWAVGVIPFAAALLAGYALVRFGFPRKALVFASVAIASTCWLVLEVALDAAAFDPTTRTRNHLGLVDFPRIHERYVIYLMPLFFVALFAALPRLLGRIPTGRHVVIAAVAGLLTALIPFSGVINRTIPVESFALLAFSRGEGAKTIPIVHATSSILAFSALLVLVYLLTVSKRLPPLAPILVTALVLLGMSTLEVGRQVTSFAPRELGLPAHADWVDRVIGSHSDVSLVGDAGGSRNALRETAFWNESINRVYYICQMAFGTDFGEQKLMPGSAPSAHYVVVPASLKVPGRVVAQDPAGKLALVIPAGDALRIPFLRCGS